MSRFIDIQISDETTPVSQEGFGLGLILDPNNEFDYVEVRDAAEIPDEAGPLAENMALTYLSQTPNPGKVAMVGYDEENYTADFAEATLNAGETNGEVTITAAQAGTLANNYTAEVIEEGEYTDFDVELDGWTLKVYLSTDGDGNAEGDTAEDVAAAIDELDEFDADYSGDGSGEIDSEETVEFEGGSDSLLQQVKGDGYTDWYGLLFAERDQGDIEDIAGQLTQELFITSPIEEEWDDGLEDYDLAGYGRVGCIPSTDEQFADAAWMSRMFATDPGSATWKWKQLEGVRSSGYESAEVSFMIDPDEGEPAMNPVIWEMGVDYTAEGKAADGSFLDIQRAIDWMTARITENIFNLLVNADKTPYTNTGISQVVSRVDSILQVAVNRGVIARDDDGVALYEIDAPSRTDVPENTRANRILPDIEFEATVAGAIHEVEVNGVLIV